MSQLWSKDKPNDPVQKFFSEDDVDILREQYINTCIRIVEQVSFYGESERILIDTIVKRMIHYRDHKAYKG